MTGIIRKVKGVDCYFLDGKKVDKARFDREMNKARPKIAPKIIKRPRGMKRGYPIKLVSMAVTTHRRDTMIAECVKRGVPTEYTKGGRPIIRDAAHYKQFRRAFGVHQNNSYND